MEIAQHFHTFHRLFHRKSAVFLSFCGKQPYKMGDTAQFGVELFHRKKMGQTLDRDLYRTASIGQRRTGRERSLCDGKRRTQENY